MQYCDRVQFKAVEYGIIYSIHLSFLECGPFSPLDWP